MELVLIKRANGMYKLCNRINTIVETDYEDLYWPITLETACKLADSKIAYFVFGDPRNA